MQRNLLEIQPPFHKCASCVAFHGFHYTVKEGRMVFFGRANIRVEVLVAIPHKQDRGNSYWFVKQVCLSGERIKHNR